MIVFHLGLLFHHDHNCYLFITVINNCCTETQITISFNIEVFCVIFDLVFCAFTFDSGCCSIFQFFTLVCCSISVYYLNYFWDKDSCLILVYYTHCLIYFFRFKIFCLILLNRLVAIPFSVIWIIIALVWTKWFETIVNIDYCVQFPSGWYFLWLLSNYISLQREELLLLNPWLMKYCSFFIEWFSYKHFQFFPLHLEVFFQHLLTFVEALYY